MPICGYHKEKKKIPDPNLDKACPAGIPCNNVTVSAGCFLKLTLFYGLLPGIFFFCSSFVFAEVILIIWLKKILIKQKSGQLQEGLGRGLAFLSRIVYQLK